MRTARPALVLLMVVAAALIVTWRDRSQPNLELFTEMAYSPAYPSQSANPVFSDGRTLQLPPEGAVPRGAEPFRYAPTPEDAARAGRELQNPIPLTLDTLTRGRSVYRNFCVHCHGPTGDGDGGVAQRVSPLAMSITGRGSSSLPEGTIYHQITYGRNNMPAHAAQIRPEDRWKVIHYLRDLQGREAVRLAASGMESEEDPRRGFLVSPAYGRELFEANCASCHGAEGRHPQPGVPTLQLAEVLAVADDQYYVDIISHGRRGSEMPAWEKILSPTQIASIVKYIRSWLPLRAEAVEPVGTALSRGGDVTRGRSLWQAGCAPCHGSGGQGGIGNSIRASSFQAMASDTFLRETIVRGRGHTAMPAGHSYGANEVTDLIAYIRNFSPVKSSLGEVRSLLASSTSRNVKTGQKVWQARCASCHGKNGEGGIGSRLNSPSFLAQVDERFLYRSIVEGRPGTAMPSWMFLESPDVADLIAWIRSWQSQLPDPPPAAVGRGRADFGEMIYRQSCQPCHGLRGAGGVGGQLANPVFLSVVSDAFLWRTIAYGKEGTAMRGFLKRGVAGALVALDEADINHVIAYLRHVQANPQPGSLKRQHFGTSLALGREIYEKKGGCASCHGASGEGASGPSLGDPDFLAVASDGFLAGTIILGRENTEMKSYYRGGNVNLTPEEVENVVAYVRSFENRVMTERRRLELTPAAAASGRDLYLRNCAACHGSEGRGPRGNRLDGFAPSLNNPQFLHAADDGFLLATIALGRSGTPMRAFGKGAGGINELSADEIRQIVAYLRSWEKEHSQ